MRPVIPCGQTHWRMEGQTGVQRDSHMTTLMAYFRDFANATHWPARVLTQLHTEIQHRADTSVLA